MRVGTFEDGPAPRRTTSIIVHAIQIEYNTVVIAEADNHQPSHSLNPLLQYNYFSMPTAKNN